MTTSLKWQVCMAEYNEARENMTKARKLLDKWLSEGIQTEVEDMNDAKLAFEHCVTRYGVSNERARASVLDDLHNIKLDDCKSGG